MAEELGSMLAWWREAGVDYVVPDAPVPWLVDPRSDDAPSRPAAAKPAAAAPPASQPLPTTLADFVAHLLTSDALPGGGAPSWRVAPSGDAASGLMILTDMPEAADVDSGSLLSGEIADLFDKMLAAIGRGRAQVYIASIVPSRTPTGRLDPAAFDAAAALARHHVRLAAPRQLWLLGDTASRAILGMGEVQANGQLHRVNLDGVMIDTIATAHPKLLLRDPERRHRRRMWTEMQRLNDGATA